MKVKDVSARETIGGEVRRGMIGLGLGSLEVLLLFLNFNNN